jgi:microcin C transport system permease protein
MFIARIFPEKLRSFKLAPINQRRVQQFKANKRGYWSLWIFLALFTITLFAEFVANDKPLVVIYNGHVYLPVLSTLSETTFGGDFESEADYTDSYVQNLINENGRMI